MEQLSDLFRNYLLEGLFISGAFLLLGIGLLLLWIIFSFLIDITQTSNAIRRNYPVIGRFRYLFEHLGEFFRQYFFAMDREEQPFNRAQRSWAYRAAKDISNTVAFGSTKDLNKPGTILFVNSPFPTLDEDAVSPGEITLGPYCREPYTTESLVNISGMSYGALSDVAIEALSRGAEKAGCWLNTGEGGVSRYHREGHCDLVFQIGTAKNGVRDLDGNLSDDKLTEVSRIEQVKMFEIKLSQGAKPGKGGILPAAKVTKEIAAIRNVPEGQAAISPNRHVDIACNRDLLMMVNHVREVTGLPVGFKTVISDNTWLDELCDEIERLGARDYAPDFITVDGADGGTGAAPMPLMDDMGLPLRESLVMLVDTLTRRGLRERIKVIASGKLITPTEVAWALCVGADFIATARGFMFALGCIQALQCNRNTCPTGITTHDKKLQKGLDPEIKYRRVANYADNLVKEIGIIAHSCGVASARQLNRRHARIVGDNGRSIPLDLFYPPVESEAGKSRV